MSRNKVPLKTHANYAATDQSNEHKTVTWNKCITINQKVN